MQDLGDKKINHEIFSIQRDSLERQKLFLKHDAHRERTDFLCVRVVWRADLLPPLLNWDGAEERSGDS